MSAPCEGCGRVQGERRVTYKWNKWLQAYHKSVGPVVTLTEIDLAGHGKRHLCQLCHKHALHCNANLANVWRSQA
jgi:hypothetical protein